VLTGLANFLNHYPKGAASGVVGKQDYTKLLKQYAELHYNPNHNGTLDLEEDYYPDTGAPIVGLKRSHHYFHSGYIDNVISGLVGVRPSADDVLEVNPAADASITYFRVDRIIYHGHEIAIQWDVDGSRYGSAGLKIEVDGKVVASSPTLARLKVSLSRISPPPITRKIAQSIQLNSTQPFPKGSVSVSGVDAKTIYGSIDGRVWFFPESDVANGWSTPVFNGSELWYQVDFGSSKSIDGAEIAFFANQAQGFDAPSEYRVQVDTADSWADVTGATYAEPVANGITSAKWTAATGGKFRLVFKPKAGKKVRLVEFKLF
jgi:hypothetical protein